MNGKNLLGVPVIDELRLCYVAEPSLLNELSGIPVGQSAKYSNYYLIRVSGDRFEFNFEIFSEDGEIGKIIFGKFGWHENSLLYYWIKNSVLYDQKQLELALALPETLGLYFNNFTAIDIAIDSTKNFSAIIKRMMRNKKITTILNGRAIKDRRAIITGLDFDYSSSLSRLHYPTITFKQARAVKNKTKGIIVQSYDKKAEIKTNSNKDYILYRYDNPRYLYRLEVRLNYQELRDYFRKAGKPQSVDVLFDPDFLLDLFFYHLGAVLRFTRGRKPLAWQDIIQCGGRV